VGSQIRFLRVMMSRVESEGQLRGKQNGDGDCFPSAAHERERSRSISADGLSNP